jgi:hypothetical protein
LSQRGRKLNAKPGFRKAFRHSFRYAVPKSHLAAQVLLAIRSRSLAVRGRDACVFDWKPLVFVSFVGGTSN